MHLDNDGVRLHVAVDGDPAAPPLLVMHGILASGRTWDWMVPRLSDRFRVLRLDFRGHGESDRAPGRYQIADYVSDAVAVCERVAHTPVAVIGHSLGGATAAALAQQRPELVRGILMEDPPLAVPDRAARSDEHDALLDSFALMRAGIPRLQAMGMSVDEVADIVRASPGPTGRVLGEFLADDAIETMAIANLAVDASVLDVVLEGTMVYGFDPARPIPVPVAVIAADPASPDAVLSPADLARLLATSPDVRAHTLVGSNHLIHDTADQRERFWELVDAFLAPFV